MSKDLLTILKTTKKKTEKNGGASSKANPPNPCQQHVLRTVSHFLSVPGFSCFGTFLSQTRHPQPKPWSTHSEAESLGSRPRLAPPRFISAQVGHVRSCSTCPPCPAQPSPPPRSLATSARVRTQWEQPLSHPCLVCGPGALRPAAKAGGPFATRIPVIVNSVWYSRQRGPTTLTTHPTTSLRWPLPKHLSLSSISPSSPPTSLPLPKQPTGLVGHMLSFPLTFASACDTGYHITHSPMAVVLSS